MSTTAAAALAKKRVRRQKQIIAVGTVVLLAILGFQLPKMLSHDKTAGLAVTTTTVPTAPSGSPSPLAAAPFTGTLADTDGIPMAPNTSQLVSFGLFKSKDPFVQQLSTVAKPAPTTPPPAPAPAQKKPATHKAKTVTTPATASPPVAPAVVTTAAPTPTPTVTSPSPTPGQVITPTEAPTAPTTTPSTTTAAPTVFISTNGVCEQVSVDGTFPGDDDVFRVVEVAKNGKWVKIGIVGGSYDSGQATATAKLGVKLTLVNTADGTRYVILLQTKCAPAPAGSAPGSSTPVTTPPPPVVPAPVVPAQSSTPPIVTDGYDPTPAPSN